MLVAEAQGSSDKETIKKNINNVQTIKGNQAEVELYSALEMLQKEMQELLHGNHNLVTYETIVRVTIGEPEAM